MTCVEVKDAGLFIFHPSLFKQRSNIVQSALKLERETVSLLDPCQLLDQYCVWSTLNRNEKKKKKKSGMTHSLATSIIHSGRISVSNSKALLIKTF